MRVSEVYLSVQGEGPRVGHPTVFVRFAGCNLRCASWPCDTPHAIFPELYRNEWKTQTPLEVWEEIKRVAGGRPAYNICFTGGEPFLQRGNEVDDLINLILFEGKHYGTIECFSNGTMRYTNLAISTIAFVMDWKLPGSGESSNVPTRMKNFRDLHYKDAIKFTIADRNDYEQAKDVYQDVSSINEFPSWYYGAVWGKQDNAELIDWVLEDKLPWLFTMQVHNVVWDRTQRGI